MGNILNRLFRRLVGDTEVKILMLGLDAAGKTTTLHKLRLGELTTTIPTLGFVVETVQYKSLTMVTWDVGGRGKIRPLWRHYYQSGNGTQGLIFVVDSNDRERIDEAANELSKLVNEDELKNVKLLVLCNKQEITDKLGLADYKREWYIQATCAVSGDGLYEGLDWLTMAISREIGNAALQTAVSGLTGGATDGEAKAN